MWGVGMLQGGILTIRTARGGGCGDVAGRYTDN